MTLLKPVFDFDLTIKLRPYILDSVIRTGAIIVCPGGAYEGLAEYEGEPIAMWLNSIGLSALVLEYRVSPHKYPEPLLDAQRAIRYVRCHAEKWNIEPNKVGILGFSAGGHLAAMTATHFDLGIQDHEDIVERTSCRPDLLIACYPVISFGEFRNDPSMINLLGANPEEHLKQLLSCELQVSPMTPPAFLWHTADDQAVPVENCLLLGLALSKHKVPFDLHIYESGPHGMGLANEDEHIGTWKSSCAEWLKKRQFITK